MVGRTPGKSRKGVGTFSGIRYFWLSSVGHRLRRAPVEDSANAELYAHFKHGGASTRQLRTRTFCSQNLVLEVIGKLQVTIRHHVALV